MKYSFTINRNGYQRIFCDNFIVEFTPALITYSDGVKQETKMRMDVSVVGEDGEICGHDFNWLYDVNSTKPEHVFNEIGIFAKNLGKDKFDGATRGIGIRCEYELKPSDDCVKISMETGSAQYHRTGDGRGASAMLVVRTDEEMPKIDNNSVPEEKMSELAKIIMAKYGNQ